MCFCVSERQKGSGRETEMKCNSQGVQGGRHKALQLRGCTHDWCPWGDDEFIQTEATQQSLIKTENTRAQYPECKCNKPVLVTQRDCRRSSVGESPERKSRCLQCFSSEHVALLMNWLTSKRSPKTAALTVSSSHIKVKALGPFHFSFFQAAQAVIASYYPCLRSLHSRLARACGSQWSLADRWIHVILMWTFCKCFFEQ